MATSLAPTDIVPAAPVADTPVIAISLTGTSVPTKPEADTPVSAIDLSPTPTEPTAPEGRLSKEEALAKVAAAAGIKPEEAVDVNQPTFAPPSGVSAEVPSEP